MEGARPVVVLDFGSQYTQLIARRVREIGVHSILLPADVSLEKIRGRKPAAVILSGGPRSVTDASALHLPEGFFEYCRGEELPVLGICYGLQVIAATLGGEVQEVSGGGEYGRMEIQTDTTSDLYQGEERERQVVWMSHGDVVTKLPEGFAVVGRSKEKWIVAIENAKDKIYGLQYHPEVSHSERGTAMLRRFIEQICHVEPTWTIATVLETEKLKIQNTVGDEDHVICALSGGVDSAVAAVLVHGVIGDRLHCAFVDNGLLRYKEQERVSKMFHEHLHLPVTVVDRSNQTLEKLQGVTDPEAKRKVIGAEFIATFKNFRDELEQKIGKKAKFLVQGTLYPDVIESCPPPGSGQKHSHTIKSHHNVGGLPLDLQFQLIEPLRELFKDEVRALGLLLGVPEQFIKRHPFPGPGLGVRILGDVTKNDALETLRRADEIFIEAIREFGDRRTHSYVVGLRAVRSSDGMTADWFPFDPQFLQTVSSRICNKVHNVNRVVYDITSKPPGTIEWE